MCTTYDQEEREHQLSCCQLEEEDKRRHCTPPIPGTHSIPSHLCKEPLTLTSNIAQDGFLGWQEEVGVDAGQQYYCHEHDKKEYVDAGIKGRE
jgi:hypothetical protein